MTKKQKIKAILFDVFGTVVDWRSSIADEVRQIPELQDVNGEHFADLWRGKYQPAMEKIRRGNRQFVKLDLLHYENLIDVLDELKISDLGEQTIRHLNLAWHRLNPWPDSVEGLNRLKGKFIIATLSNGNVSLIINMAKRAELPWDMVLGAEVVGHYKPQPESYLKSAAMLDLPPQQCLLVAAHNSDLIAATECGYKTAFVARPTEYGPHQDFDLKAISNYDYVATDFIDLAMQLDC